MPIDGDLPDGTIIAGRYRVIETAGSGGMGIVYVVEHVNTGGRAALKLMRGGRGNERAVERFRREARASAIIQSEHVVRVTDADVAPELEDAPFLVMELLQGEDLSERLAREKKLDADDTVQILTQVARGLERAHAAGVVHRDLKPQNIFLHQREDGLTIAKIVDFGISRILHPKVDGREVTGLTRADDLVGSPAWMSPEQAMAMHHAVGPATDVWAVGLVAFRMLTGESYWGEREAQEILAALMKPERTPPSRIDPRLSNAFDQWFLKSCAREPERRFQTAFEQAEALAIALDDATQRKPMTLDPMTADPEHTAPTGVQLPIAPSTHQDFGGEAVEEATTQHRNRPARTSEPEPEPDELATPPFPFPEDQDELRSTLPKRTVFGAPPTSVRATAPMPAMFGPFAPAPTPSDRSASTMSPLFLAPTKPAWTQHLVWVALAVVFGGAFVAGVIWLVVTPDPPGATSASSRPPPAPSTVTDAPDAAVTEAGPVESAEAPPPPPPAPKPKAKKPRSRETDAPR